MVVAAAAVGGLAVPGTAHAAPGCWQGIETTRAGELMVKGSLGSPSPSTLLIHLRDKQTGARVATVDKFPRVDYHEHAFEFDVYSDPIKLDKLGLYAIEVESADGIAQCGDFDYRLRSEFSHVSTTGKVSLDNLTTTFSADVTTFDPRTWQTSPLRNADVRLEGDSASMVATTDDEGHLSVPFTFSGVETIPHIAATMAATAEMDAEYKFVQPSVARQQASIELDANSRNLKARYGQVVKITGRATRTAADGTVKPVPAGTPLLADVNGVPVVGADGRFERNVRALADGPIYTTWARTSRYPWLEHVGGATQIDLQDISLFESFKASVDAAKRVTVTGALQRKPGYGGGSLKVEIQYSADGRTGWTTRKTFTTEFFSGIEETLPGPADGYWRLRFAGTAEVLGSVTKPLRVTRTDTAFSAFNVNPEPVRRGKPLTVTGTLKHKSPTWKTYGGQTVYVYFRPAGSQTLTYMGRGTTAADGTFKRVFTAEGTGTWLARYRDSDGKHVNAQSRLDEVTVNR
ncbi:hypothetical protein [Streptomyces griseus]|uniref:hypothetical protein n=1 Tax=Streptomyces griseus TaxID=1911 RepID=UPI000AD88569|nr:hypothetical protein [Streptomyces griseus]